MNFNSVAFNYMTGFYECSDTSYSTYTEARKYQWKCEKCNEGFQGYKKLKNHKRDLHSY